MRERANFEVRAASFKSDSKCLANKRGPASSDGASCLALARSVAERGFTFADCGLNFALGVLGSTLCGHLGIAGLLADSFLGFADGGIGGAFYTVNCRTHVLSPWI